MESSITMAGKMPGVEVDPTAASLLSTPQRSDPERASDGKTNKTSGNLNQARVFWSGPSLLIVPLICGVLFSLGHHLLYHRLDGQFLDESTLDQKWAIR